MTNPLQRGIDPYADAEVARRLLAPVVQVQHADLENASSVFTLALISGRIRKLKVSHVVALDTNPAVLTITTALGAMVATVSVTEALTIGDAESFNFADEVNSVVLEGESIEIASDGGPASVGTIDLYLEIDPGTRAADGT